MHPPKSLSIAAITPERGLVTVHGALRVQVRGRGYGLLCCGSERRWVWGAFSESFRISRPGSRFVLWSLGGVERRAYSVAGGVDLQPPRTSRSLRVATTPPKAPRLRRLELPASLAAEESRP